MKYVCCTNNFFTIDTTALYFLNNALEINANDEIVIVIDNLNENSTNYKNGIFEYKNNIPSLKFDLDKSNEPKLTYFVIPQEANTIEYVNLLKKACDCFIEKTKINTSFKQRLIELEHQLIQLFGKENNVSREALISETIVLLLSDSIKYKISTILLSDIYSLEEDNNYVFTTIINISRQLAKQHNGNFIFYKGGYIELNFKDRVLKIKSGIKSTEVMFYISEFNQYLNYSELISFIKENKVDVYFRGPLIICLLSSIGRLVHLPWYSKIKSNLDDNFVSFEFISPITVSDIKRTSKIVGGDGQRLFPSGYTLLDYKKNANVNTYITKICNLKKTNNDSDTQDVWLDLTQNYPLSKQKGAKSSKQIWNYINLKEKKLRQEPFFEIMEELYSSDFSNPMLFGLNLLKFKILFNEYRSIWFSPKNYSKNSHNYFIHCGWISNDGKHNFHISIKDLFLLINNIYTWEKMFIDSISDCNIDIFFKKPSEISDSMSFDEINKLFNSINKLIICSIERYYSFVTLLTNTVLRANIWNLWCINGTHLNNMFADIINERQIRYYTFTPDITEYDSIK